MKCVIDNLKRRQRKVGKTNAFDASGLVTGLVNVHLSSSFHAEMMKDAIAQQAPPNQNPPKIAKAVPLEPKVRSGQRLILHVINVTNQVIMPKTVGKVKTDQVFR